MKRLAHANGRPWDNLEVDSLKLELRERVEAVGEREADLYRWEADLERREARVERQRLALRRRRVQVAKRLLRLRGRIAVQTAERNGDEPLLDDELARQAVEAGAPADSEDASSDGHRSRGKSRRTKASPPGKA